MLLEPERSTLCACDIRCNFGPCRSFGKSSGCRQPAGGGGCYGDSSNSCVIRQGRNSRRLANERTNERRIYFGGGGGDGGGWRCCDGRCSTICACISPTRNSTRTVKARRRPVRREVGRRSSKVIITHSIQCNSESLFTRRRLGRRRNSQTDIVAFTSR